MAEDAAKEPMEFSEPDYKEIYSRVEKAGKKEMTKAFSLTDKQKRTVAVSSARTNITEKLSEDDQLDPLLSTAIKKLESDIVRGAIIKGGKRIDGRDNSTVRPDSRVIPTIYSLSTFYDSSSNNITFKLLNSSA